MNPVTFTNNSTISGNTSEEYVIKVDTQGTYGTTGVSVQLQLTSADTINSSTLYTGGGTNWQWNDSTVAAGTYLNGYLVKNLPLTGNLFVH